MMLVVSIIIDREKVLKHMNRLFALTVFFSESAFFFCITLVVAMLFVSHIPFAFAHVKFFYFSFR